MQETTLDLLKRLAKALSAQFGDNCEIVVHDISSGDPENTIAVIETDTFQKETRVRGLPTSRLRR